MYVLAPLIMLLIFDADVCVLSGILCFNNCGFSFLSTGFLLKPFPLKPEITSSVFSLGLACWRYLFIHPLICPSFRPSFYL